MAATERAQASRGGWGKRTGIALAGALGLAAVGSLGAGIGTTPPPAAAVPALTPFASCAEVDAWLARGRPAWTTPGPRPFGPYGEDYALLTSASGVDQGGVLGPDTAAVQARVRATTDDAVGPGQTGTNTQEREVDDPDVAKAVGGRLFTVSGGKLRVLDVSGKTPVPLGSVAIPAARRGVSQSELLIAGDRLVVLTTVTTYRTTTPAASTVRVLIDRVTGSSSMPWGVEATSTATVVDVSRPAAPTLVNGVRRAGRTVTARLAGGVLRWVTASADRPDHLDCARIQRPEVPSGVGILSVDTLDPAAATTAKGRTGIVDSIGVAGDGSMVYASVDRLYVATSPGGWMVPFRADGPTPGPAEPPRDETVVHGFDIGTASATRYAGSGRVEGRLLNQWSMSERDGFLRVATTRNQFATMPVPAPAARSRRTPPPVPRSDAAVTVLAERDGELTRVGRVTGLGKGEQLKSVRWFDDLAVVVTFRQTDPLYVVDLGDPTTPRVRGALKVDGFSAYLHPIGNRQLLGIGQAANPKSGAVTGAQIATFDIADPQAPRRLDVAVQPNAWTRVGDDPRVFSYLPRVRRALYPLDSIGSRLVAFTVRGDGSLVEAGAVDVPNGWDTRQVAIGDSRVAVVSPGLGGQPGRVALVDASGAKLVRTGLLALPTS